MHVDNCSDTIYQTPLTILQPALNAMYLSISHDNTPELNVVCADKFEIMIQHRIERHESVLSFSDFDLQSQGLRKAKGKLDFSLKSEYPTI